MVRASVWVLHHLPLHMSNGSQSATHRGRVPHQTVHVDMWLASVTSAAHCPSPEPHNWYCHPPTWRTRRVLMEQTDASVAIYSNIKVNVFHELKIVAENVYTRDLCCAIADRLCLALTPARGAHPCGGLQPKLDFHAELTWII